MRSALRSTIRRSVTVLIGSAVVALVAAGPVSATAAAAHSVGTAHAAAAAVSKTAYSIGLLGASDFCDFTPAC
ncbi:MAG: hypothetical protein ACRDTG_06045 [Pseudonocardiaceae bacterium]